MRVPRVVHASDRRRTTLQHAALAEQAGADTRLVRVPGSMRAA
ncbi:hypothetical protein MYA_5968 [Burkholderia sp. KJ006]|nr:hypothetical protein MYA_5968 [Burkholderia sp. KJ006]